MENKTLTAVEWLIKKLTNRQNGVFDGLPHLSVDEMYEQALALEKEQHDITSLDWFNEGERYAKRDKREYDDFEQYYTTKYGKQ